MLQSAAVWLDACHAVAHLTPLVVMVSDHQHWRNTEAVDYAPAWNINHWFTKPLLPLLVLLSLRAKSYEADRFQVWSLSVQIFPRVCTFIYHRRALSCNRCRGLTMTMFQFTDRQPAALTNYCWQPSFLVAAAHVWNSLPEHITSTPCGWLPVSCDENSSVLHLFMLLWPNLL